MPEDDLGEVDRAKGDGKPTAEEDELEITKIKFIESIIFWSQRQMQRNGKKNVKEPALG